MTEQEIKHLSDLEPKDFRSHHIWSWYDDDASTVMPVEITHPLVENDHSVFWIFADLILNDGTSIQGTIGINLERKMVYFLSFFKGDEEFIFSGTLPPKDMGNLEQLSNWLGKSMEEITPLKYETPYFLEDGTPIKGELDLEEW